MVYSILLLINMATPLEIDDVGAANSLSIHVSNLPPAVLLGEYPLSKCYLIVLVLFCV